MAVRARLRPFHRHGRTREPQLWAEQQRGRLRPIRADHPLLPCDGRNRPDSRRRAASYRVSLSEKGIRERHVLRHEQPWAPNFLVDRRSSGDAGVALRSYAARRDLLTAARRDPLTPLTVTWLGHGRQIDVEHLLEGGDLFEARLARATPQTEYRTRGFRSVEDGVGKLFDVDLVTLDDGEHVSQHAHAIEVSHDELEPGGRRSAHVDDVRHVALDEK